MAGKKAHGVALKSMKGYTTAKNNKMGTTSKYGVKAPGGRADGNEAAPKGNRRISQSGAGG